MDINTDIELFQKILKVGIENCLFIVKMRPIRTALGLISYTSSSDEPIEVPATIIEDRYKVADNYKVRLKCIYEGFGYDDYYLSDLESLISRGQVKFYIKVIPAQFSLA